MANKDLNPNVDPEEIRDSSLGEDMYDGVTAPQVEREVNRDHVSDGAAIGGAEPTGASLTTAQPAKAAAPVLVDEEEEEAEDGKKSKRLSRNRLVARRFFRNKTAIAGLALFSIVVFLAFFGQFLTPWDFIERDRGQYLKPPSPQHFFGTNQLGRDMFALTIEGLRKSLLIGLAVACIQTTVAALIGAAAAYFGGIFDKVALWFIDLLLVVPSFLIIAIMAQRFGSQKSSILFFIILLAMFGWMLSARVVRSLTLSVRSLEYVTAAKYMSVPSYVIIFRHILPNISSLLIIDATLGVASAVLAETSLSYFGFGVKDPQTSLGSLIGAAQSYALTHPWIFMPPALVLTLMLVSVNFIGDGVRDALDPSSKSGGSV